ncbi:hypothetical protein [Kitasatospora aureofaciens]|uniref:hypothetical protein n=1 Tax=Kitasatospora aureofaciens TaxID=1894 RepID=UPI003804D462
MFVPGYDPVQDLDHQPWDVWEVANTWRDSRYSAVPADGAETDLDFMFVRLKPVKDREPQ